jgi:hypothetical protein
LSSVRSRAREPVTTMVSTSATGAAGVVCATAGTARAKAVAGTRQRRATRRAIEGVFMDKSVP